MRDALGGSVVFVIIVVFMVVVLSYLAFNVNFTKASRMKNKIIATYEEYQGICKSDCQNKIVDYSKEIGYDVGNATFNCNKLGSDKGHSYNKGPGSTAQLLCVEEKVVDNVVTNEATGIYGIGYKKVYYKIATRINIELPIIQNIFNYQMFWITGDTKAFTIKN